MNSEIDARMLVDQEPLAAIPLALDIRVPDHVRRVSDQLDGAMNELRSARRDRDEVGGVLDEVVALQNQKHKRAVIDGGAAPSGAQVEKARLTVRAADMRVSALKESVQILAEELHNLTIQNRDEILELQADAVFDAFEAIAAALGSLTRHELELARAGSRFKELSTKIPAAEWNPGGRQGLILGPERNTEQVGRAHADLQFDLFCRTADLDRSALVARGVRTMEDALAYVLGQGLDGVSGRGDDVENSRLRHPHGQSASWERGAAVTPATSTSRGW